MSVTSASRQATSIHLEMEDPLWALHSQAEHIIRANRHSWRIKLKFVRVLWRPL